MKFFVSLFDIWKTATRENYQKQYQISRENKNSTKIIQIYNFFWSSLNSFISLFRSGSKQLPSVYLFSFFWHIKRKIKFIKSKSCVFFSGGAAVSFAFASNSKQWNNNNKFIWKNLKRLQFLLWERASYTHFASFYYSSVCLHL